MEPKIVRFSIRKDALKSYWILYKDSTQFGTDKFESEVITSRRYDSFREALWDVLYSPYVHVDCTVVITFVRKYFGDPEADRLCMTSIKHSDWNNFDFNAIYKTVNNIMDNYDNIW